MPRKPRVEVEDGIYHVYARGVDRRPIFLDAADRQAYLNLLAHVTGVFRWLVLAYCLMDNHVHLVIETPERTLARGMQRLHGVYARDFNEIHGRVGHLFQGRYGSRSLTTDEELWGAIAYVVWNPLEAGFRELERYEWSSHAPMMGRSEAPPWLARDRLLHHLAAAGHDPRSAYARLTAVPPPRDA